MASIKVGNATIHLDKGEAQQLAAALLTLAEERADYRRMAARDALASKTAREAAARQVDMIRGRSRNPLEAVFGGPFERH
ncbi:hypothetical protein [Actinosynnema sp. NPDC020468]|uniref:hypothetical protein n=1 Tax=Actinosynnema sp. NPDC020468 TaxID=3154488 RepID=UPI00340269A7